MSNTERLNRAVGLPAVEFTARPEPEPGAGRSRVRRFGQFLKLGMTAAWEEHPFEWVEGRRMGVLREYSRGPFRWLVSVVELTPRAGGGTTLAHRVRLQQRGLLGRTIAAVEVGLKGRRAVERVYRRIDAAVRGRLGDRALADPFEEPESLSASRRRRLEALLDRLVSRGVNPAVAERLGDFLALAPAQEVARIRPLALARRLSLDPARLVDACLHGAREGLLALLWDIICPVCRIPSEARDTLQALGEHGHCEACNLDFDLDFGGGVEMVFRAHPEVRSAELGVYCIGGPAHSPHVAAQVRLSAGERLALELALGEGAYRLRGPQLPFVFEFRVEPAVSARRLELDLTRGPGPETARSLRTGGQVLLLSNDSGNELLVRVERTADRDDALTAARASSLALFRELFPGEVLAPGRLAAIATVTLLMTDLEGADDLYVRLGDAAAFALLHEHFRQLNGRVRHQGGTLVKTVGAGVVAVFHEAESAMRAALDLQTLAPAELRVRAAVHRGPALVATVNDHLDYFGDTVRQATDLLHSAHGGELVLSQSLAAHLSARGLRGEVLRDGDRGRILLRLSLPGLGH